MNENICNVKHIIGFNFTDFRVCWHKMSSNNCKHDIYVKDLEDDDSFDEDDEQTLIIKNCGTSKEKNDYQTLLEALVGCVKDRKANDYSFISQTKQQLIGQISLFNKYNKSKINDLNYELNDKNELIIKGVLKINWSIKKAIKLANESVIPINFKKTNSDDFDDSLKSSYDDSTIQSQENRKSKPNGLYRSNTVSYKNKSIRRPSRHINNNDQNFIPSYNSMSGIHIDNLTTCEDAIKILFEKYHITNSPTEYSLYKILQTGEKRELNALELPLLERLRMGPFDEDKLFIMEKGIEINTSIETENLFRLPENLLYGLLENLKREENKTIEFIKKRYLNYKEGLLNRLQKLEQYV